MTKVSSRPAPDPLAWLDDAWGWYRETYGPAWEQMWERLAPGPAPGRRTQRCEGCDPCGCCEPVADVVVRARPGERRVVPVAVTNTWRRDRTVTISLGGWTLCDGDARAEVNGQVEPAGEVVLGPCETRTLLVVLEVARPDGRKEGPARAGACASWVTELEVAGCGRSRIGVVVLPPTCEPVELCCSCGCCEGC